MREPPEGLQVEYTLNGFHARWSAVGFGRRVTISLVIFALAVTLGLLAVFTFADRDHEDRVIWSLLSTLASFVVTAFAFFNVSAAEHEIVVHENRLTHEGETFFLQDGTAVAGAFGLELTDGERFERIPCSRLHREWLVEQLRRQRSELPEGERDETAVPEALENLQGR